MIDYWHAWIAMAFFLVSAAMSFACGWMGDEYD